jgi:hypothetical protein
MRALNKLNVFMHVNTVLHASLLFVFILSEHVSASSINILALFHTYSALKRVIIFNLKRCLRVCTEAISTTVPGCSSMQLNWFYLQSLSTRCFRSLLHILFYLYVFKVVTFRIILGTATISFTNIVILCVCKPVRHCNSMSVQ